MTIVRTIKVFLYGVIVDTKASPNPLRPRDVNNVAPIQQIAAKKDEMVEPILNNFSFIN
ncbi:hypothetical protein [Anaerosolibacter sp.]|uniref:hypothetical protein n=1 Tax=Anaerosolibacter sp. TaxID=1872527 RepID=UPI0039EFF5BB